MMSVAFLEKDPFIVVGGIIPEINSNSKIGNSEYFVAEADESDNSFLFIKPKYAVVTNVEPDHLEHHGTFENIKKSFEQFIDSTERLVLLCKDTVEKEHLKFTNKNVAWYSLESEDAQIYAKDVEIKDGKTSYEVVKNGESLGRFTLTIPGKHNILNSLPVIYLAHEFKCDMNKVKEKIEEFKGANRRYQVIYDNNLRIIDDYAHHPTEVSVTIEAAKSTEKGKVTVIFQPHRYTRTKFFLDGFVEALKKADDLMLLPIYAASEDNIYGISSEDLAEKIGNHVKVTTEEEIEKIVEESKNSGNTFVFMGAGSVSKVAHNIVDKLNANENKNK